MKKVLFIASHRKDRAPGQRFRFEQYFEFLNANGYECELSYFLGEYEDRILYSKGKFFQKLSIVLKAAWIRWKNVRKRNQYSIIFIFREAFMTGSLFFEKKFRDSNAKLIFDFDDAIWHLDISKANRRFSFLKNPSKTGQIIKLCDMVFAGNSYLANYSKNFCERVVIIPTTIDTDEYIRIRKPETDTVTIGWSGSITTIKHFEFALPFLREIKKRYGDKIRIKVIGDASYRNSEFGITGIGWTKQDEIKELSDIDIGIMPLHDDEWAKGKCGLKGLQYMALEIPTIMSPVGVNTEIITDGINGFLASTTDEWVDKIGKLVDSKSLRTQMGTKARERVLQNYSVHAWQKEYLRYFDELTSHK